MRKMLEELRKNLGMPLDQGVDGDNDDFGYRSTLGMTDLETRYDRHLPNEVDVPVQRAASPVWSESRQSPPPHPTGYGGDVGRPPRPRHGRSRSDHPGTGSSQDSVDVRETSPQQIVNVLTIDDHYENNTSCSTYNRGMDGSDDGYDEVDSALAQGRVTPPSARSVISPSDPTDRRRQHEYRHEGSRQSHERSFDGPPDAVGSTTDNPSDRPGSSSTDRRRHGGYRREKGRPSTERSFDGLPDAVGSTTDNPSDRPGSSLTDRRRHGGYRREDGSHGTRLSPERSFDNPPDSVGSTTDNPHSLADRSDLALNRTRTIEVTGGLENGEVGHSKSSVSYRDSDLHDDVSERADKHEDGYDEEDADSYGAYDNDDQLLDTLNEYQQKLEKTNFVDDVGEDSMEDEAPAPMPLPRRQPLADKPASTSPAGPRSTTPPGPEFTSPRGPESPSDSLDVSELEEDEYLQ